MTPREAFQEDPLAAARGALYALAVSAVLWVVILVVAS